MLTPAVWRGAGPLCALAAALLGGCAADRPLRTPDVGAAIKSEMGAAAAPVASKGVPAAVSESLAEPTTATAVAPEPRIDLLINNAQVRDVFLAIVADTRYSMLMHPEVKGTLSVTLRGVTVKEALDAIRDVYGYDYKMEGRRITVFPPTLQTRVFTVNYPNSQRVGASDLRVSSGARPVPPPPVRAALAQAMQPSRNSKAAVCLPVRRPISGAKWLARCAPCWAMVRDVP
jgi:MSHA biogenesis protein MshL